MRNPPVPNRLVKTPDELYERMEQLIANVADAPLPDYQRLICWAYLRGYQDSCRDGHTDAESGHGERVRAALA